LELKNQPLKSTVVLILEVRFFHYQETSRLLVKNLTDGVAKSLLPISWRWMVPLEKVKLLLIALKFNMVVKKIPDMLLSDSREPLPTPNLSRILLSTKVQDGWSMDSDPRT
jgi:hypothetical protein